MQIVESPEDVTKFLHLQQLELSELKTQCKAIGHEVTDESKPALIKMIMKGKNEPIPSQGLLSQGIPLRSKDRHGKTIPGAIKNYKHWRNIIFNEVVDNLKDFDFVNKDGKQYSTKVWYVKCDIGTATHIIQNKWHSTYESQKDLIQQIKQDPNQFVYHIVQKNAGNGNNFLMLHCQLKKD
tara:strand:- start:407 stop:949 length:543 start_codon:yes stop_codon:yes gene_type:complete